MTTDELETRIVRLERSQRRWRRGACALALGGVAAVSLGQASQPTPTGVLEARRFVVKDRSGKIRGELAYAADTNTVALHLYRKDGRPTAGLVTTGDGTSSFFLKRGKHVRVALRADVKQTEVSIADEAGRSRLTLGASTRAGGAVRYRDEQGATVAGQSQRRVQAPEGIFRSAVETERLLVVGHKTPAQRTSGGQIKIVAGRQPAILLSRGARLGAALTMDGKGGHLAVFEGKNRGHSVSSSKGRFDVRPFKFKGAAFP